MTITRKQCAAMAAIVLLGLLAGGGMLLTGRHPAGGEATPAEPDEAHGEAAHAKRDEHPVDRVVKLSETQARQAGIGLQPAGAATLETAVEFPGEIRFDEDRTAHLVPRLAGVAEQVSATLGQRVQKGQVMAVLASAALSDLRSELLTAQRRREAAGVSYQRERSLWEEGISAAQDHLQAQAALQEADIAVQNARQKLGAVGATAATSALNRFEVRAPFAGTVVEKHLTLGEAVGEDARIYTLSDLRTVWAEFNLAPKDLARVRVDQRVRVSSTAFDGQAEGRVAHVGTLIGEQTRSARARVALANPDGVWRPGLFVTVTVLGPPQPVPLTVPVDAVQTIQQQATVFKAVAGGFEAMPVRVGRTDGRSVEILGGLAAGDPVASRNAYLLKSELGKAGAGHSH